MVAEVGDVVGLFYDSANTVSVGDYLRTRTGRTYRTVAVRIQHRGQHIGRQHLRAEVVNPAEVAPQDPVHAIYWYRRHRTARRPS